MITPKTIYINVDADDPAEALVPSSTNLQGKSIGTIVAGDFLEYTIVPVTANGTSSIAGSSDVKLQVGIGRYDVGTMCKSDYFYASASYGWTGSLNTNTGSFTSVVTSANSDAYSAQFEVQLTRTTGAASGSQITILQTPITIRQQILS
jgi:hypothetical protein